MNTPNNDPLVGLVVVVPVVAVELDDEEVIAVAL